MTTENTQHKKAHVALVVERTFLLYKAREIRVGSIEHVLCGEDECALELQLSDVLATGLTAKSASKKALRRVIALRKAERARAANAALGG